MLTRVANLFGVKSNEATLVLLLVIHSFFVGMPRTIGSAVAFGMLDDSLVPLALILSAVLSTMITLSFDALQKRMSFVNLAFLNLIFQALLIGTFYVIFSLIDDSLLIRNTEISWNIELIILIFFVIIQVIMVLTYREYWGLAGKLMDIRQSKRLFALIASGEVIFAIVIGLLRGSLPKPAYHLLPLGIVGIIGSIMVVFVIKQRFGNLLKERSPSRSKRCGVSNQQQLTFSPYVILILALAAIYAVGFGLAQQIYVTALEGQFPIEDERVEFIIVLTAITGVFNLIMRLFAADRLLARFGVTVGLLFLPILVLMSSGALSAMYIAGVGENTQLLGLGLIFVMVMLIRSNYFILKSSLDRPSSLILLQTMPEKPRRQLLNIQDGIVTPIATGLTGMVLFISTIPELFPVVKEWFPALEGFDFGSPLLTGALTFVSIVWVIAVFLVLREYASSVLQVLQRRQIGAFSDLFQDSRNLNRIKMNLKSESPMEVVYALHVLDTLEDPLLNEALRELLKHHDDLVRGEVLKLIEKNRRKELLPQISLIAQREPQEDVRAIAVRALSALGEDDVFDVLMKYLQSRYPHIRTNAIIGLLRSGDLSGIINAGNELIDLVNSEIIADRVEAATILGEVGNRDFYRLLVDLLQDKSKLVRNAALISAGKLKNPKLWPLVINCLIDHETRSTASRALREADESVLDQFEPFFQHQMTSPTVLITLTRICSRMGGSAVVQFLFSHSHLPNLNVRKYVLEALATLEFQAESLQHQENILSHIHDELGYATWCMAATIALQVYEEKTEIVIKALAEEIEQTKERVFYWLSFIYDSHIILNAKSKVGIVSSIEWALILEALDQTLDSSLRPLILPFYEPLNLDEQFTHMNHHFPQDTSADALSYLEYIIGEEGIWIDPWLRTSTIYAAPDIATDTDLSEALYAALRFEHPMVAETALWSLSKLAPSLYKLYVSRRDDEPSDLTSKTVGVVEDTIGLIRKVMSGGESVLLTIEKVLILKKVSIFSDTSEEFLADISSLLDEINLSAGETVIKKGDEHIYLYIITDGIVEVRDDNHVLAELGPNHIFGELGLFLEAPSHTATVVAKTDAHILSLHRDDFTEILYDYAQVAHGIIRELAQRLHQSNQRNIKLNS